MAIDKHSLIDIGIDIVHAKIHDGDHYYISGYTQLDSASTFGMTFKTPASDTHAHFQWDVKSSGICELLFCEGAGDTTTGTTLTAFNSNRNSSKTSMISIVSSVTAMTTTGTVINSAKWGAGGGVVRVGGGSSRDDEIELKANTIYYGILRSFAANNIIQFNASWYEA